MQLLLLKYREDIIAAKVAQEQTLETLQSKIMFLKDQVSSEQEEKTRIEEALTQEINSLQEKLGKGYSKTNTCTELHDGKPHDIGKQGA